MTKKIIGSNSNLSTIKIIFINYIFKQNLHLYFNKFFYKIIGKLIPIFFLIFLINFRLIFWFIYYFVIVFFFILISNPQLDNHEIKPGKCLKINISVPNLRLFVGNIPKSKGKEEILDEFGKLTGKYNSKTSSRKQKENKNIQQATNQLIGVSTNPICRSNVLMCQSFRFLFKKCGII